MRRRRTKISEDERCVADRERSRKRTMDRAVRLLAAKARSVEELRECLLEKLWTDGEIVDAVIEKLKEYRYLDDEQFARDLAVSKLRQKAQGRRRLRYSMSQKKIDPHTVDAALDDAFEKLPESDLIDTAIERRLRLRGRPETFEDRKKLFDHLLRRGFDLDLVRSKISSLGDISGSYESGEQ
ncbi:MAG: RecX family transcriptional regulator [Chloracidobacterium sp.]|nr:RecX family transcriptional regulator [Chloracidobacterium sp.]